MKKERRDVIRKVLVTGATGYIGANLVKSLCEQGYEVHIILRSTSDVQLLSSLQKKLYYHVEYGDGETISKVCRNISPEIVIHLAGLFISEHKVEDIETLIQSNITFGTYVLEAIKENKVPYFINAGTHWQQCSYKNNTPINLYAATKEAFQKIADYYIDSANSRMITLKLIDTYGPFDPRGKIINILKTTHTKYKELEMSGGEQELGLVYIEDVVKAFLYAIEEITTMNKQERKIYYVAPPKMYTLREVVTIFEAIYGNKLNVIFGARPYRVREVMKITLEHPNILEGKEVLSLEKGIKKMLEEEGKIQVH